MARWVVAATLKKHLIDRLNIITDIRYVEGETEDEVIGKYVRIISEDFPEHDIHVRPLALPTSNKGYVAMPNGTAH